MLNVVTIITPSHYDKALTLIKSIRQHADAHLHVLVVGGSKDIPPNKHITIYHTMDFWDTPMAEAARILLGIHPLNAPISYTESVTSLDCLRWALKPVFMRLMLNKHERAIYCDCDVHFYGDPSPLLNTEAAMVLSPHWRPIHSTNSNEWRWTYLHGIFNGGLFACTQAADPILKWWTERCCVECSPIGDGTFVDQKYLDIVPTYFSHLGIDIIHHKGYNVAGWSIDYVKRSMQDGQLMLDDQYPLICIHYTAITVMTIMDGNDPLLMPALESYKLAVASARKDILRANPKTGALVISEPILQQEI